MPRDVLRPLVFGVVLAVGVLAAGFAAERVRFGTDDRAAFARVESDVRAALESMSSELRTYAQTIAGDTERIARAARDEDGAAADLFAAIEEVHPQHNARVAITVYGPAARAIAWSDGPAEDLPADRVTGPEALFAAQGTLGLRLVYLTPVIGEDGRRLGAVAAERVLVPALGVEVDGAARELESRLAPVELTTRFEGAGESTGSDTFIVHASTGEVLIQGRVDSADLADARARFRRAVLAVAGIVLALALAFIAGPMLDARHAGPLAVPTLVAAAALAASRLMLSWAVPDEWPMASTIEVLATGAVVLAFAALVAPLVGLLPIWLRGRRVSRVAAMVTSLAAAGTTLAVLGGYASLLAGVSSTASVDLFDFSFYPLSAARLVTLVALVFGAAAAIWLVVLALLAAVHVACRAGLPAATPPVTALVVAGVALLMPLAWIQALPAMALMAAIAASGTAALAGRRARRYYGHASHAMRLLSIWVLLALPAVLLYPVSLHFAGRAQREAIATEFAPRTAGHTNDLQAQLTAALDAIDSLPDLAALVDAAGASGPQAAFFVWDRTPLGAAQLTSAVELYGADGTLVSRFNLNLPEVDAVSQRNISLSCTWEVFGEVNRFGSEERRMLHAERGICDDGRTRGTIVVHLMPDYRALPFIRGANPYLEVLRADVPVRTPLSEDLAVTIYGWGLLPIFSSSSTPWQIPPDVFDRLYRAREPFWARLEASGRSWQVYLSNDRAGIYALGYPELTVFDHLVHVAEITTLAGAGWVLVMAGAAVFLPLARRRTNVGRVLLREIRSSFYRKLLLAFVAVSIVPVVVLALVLRAYTAGLLREDVEDEASRTAAVAQRSIENYAARQRPGGVPITDDLMVELKQVLNQSINLFEGPRLIATSERDLFASGLLPTRTPAEVYRKIALERLPAWVGEERIGDFQYLLAATPARTAGRDVILSVPLGTRSHEIEEEIQDLERGIHLAAVLFILAGSAIGLYMAERIADPVRRLTRATKRIAAGDLDARVAIKTADELRRLVDDFNRMAEELKAQRDELKRTQRLAAWAEMARQVAHEIKNPLTPIQLSAEHLRRVHQDRGEPLSPVLQQCVESILSQVTLLRQISSEFSAFASSPTVRPSVVDVGALVEELIAPYRAGLPERLTLSLDIAPSLPRVRADRALLGRAITNLFENALHAMPGPGRLALSVTRGEDGIVLTVSDTGLGMDQEALERAFEPYFSTKASGTGLGLPIARRNVELNGGRISVDSARGRGTTVTVWLPSAS